MEHTVWMENQSSLRSTPYSQQCLDLRRVHSSGRCMEGALRGAEDADFSDDGPLRICASSSIRRVYSHHVRLFVPVAHPHHPDHVPNPSNDVHPTGAAGGTRGAGGVWRNLPPIYDCDAGLFPSSGYDVENKNKLMGSEGNK